jgi:glycerophosphoryl diester phosphodiesterase
VIAHRGASGHALENSPAAFRQAVALGADGVELDVHASADGELVVHHDPAIPGLGPIAALEGAAIRRHRLANGEPVPTLAEALGLLTGLDVWVELKSLPSQWDRRLLAVLDAGPEPARYAVHSFDHRIIARLGAERPGLRRGALLASYLLDMLAVLRATGADTLWMDAELIDADLVALLHGSGFALIAWTANDEPEIARLADLGVDGICGNFPDRIRVVVERGRR